MRPFKRMGFASPGRVHRQGHEEGANAHPKGCDAMTMRTPRLVVCYIDNDAQEAQMRTNVGTTRQSDLAWCVTCCNNCSSFEPDATGATHVLTHTAPSLPSNVPTEVLNVPLVPSSSGLAQSVHRPGYVRPAATRDTHLLTPSALTSTIPTCTAASLEYSTTCAPPLSHSLSFHSSCEVLDAGAEAALGFLPVRLKLLLFGCPYTIFKRSAFRARCHKFGLHLLPLGRFQVLRSALLLTFHTSNTIQSILRELHTLRTKLSATLN